MKDACKFPYHSIAKFLENCWELLTSAPVMPLWRALKKDVRTKLLTGIVVFLILLTWVWKSVSGFLNRLQEDERRFVELFDTLNQHKELLRASIESSPDGVLVVNNQGKATHYNSNFTIMWNISQELMSKRDR